MIGNVFHNREILYKYELADMPFSENLWHNLLQEDDLV